MCYVLITVQMTCWTAEPYVICPMQCIACPTMFGLCGALKISMWRVLGWGFLMCINWDTPFFFRQQHQSTVASHYVSVAYWRSTVGYYTLKLHSSFLFSWQIPSPLLFDPSRQETSGGCTDEINQNVITSLLPSSLSSMEILWQKRPGR